MSRTEGLILAMLVRISHQLDQVLYGQRVERNYFMQIGDVLASAGTELTELETDDQAVLKALADIQANGGTLTPEQEAEATSILQRIGALDAADKAALGTPDTGAGDEGTDEPTPTTGV